VLLRSILALLFAASTPQFALRDTRGAVHTAAGRITTTRAPCASAQSSSEIAKPWSASVR